MSVLHFAARSACGGFRPFREGRGRVDPREGWPRFFSRGGRRERLELGGARVRGASALDDHRVRGVGGEVRVWFAYIVDVLCAAWCMCTLIVLGKVGGLDVRALNRSKADGIGKGDVRGFDFGLILLCVPCNRIIPSPTRGGSACLCFQCSMHVVGAPFSTSSNHDVQPRTPQVRGAHPRAGGPP